MQKKIDHLCPIVKTKSHNLKVSMDDLLKDRSYQVHWHRCLVQLIRMTKYLTRIQSYEHRYEKLAFKPVQFLQFIKNTRLPQIQHTPHLPQHCRLSLTQEFNMKDLIEPFKGIQPEEGQTRNLQPGNELMLTLMSSPKLQKSFTVEDVGFCYHISCVTPDRVWVNEWGNDEIILIDTARKDKLYSVVDSNGSNVGSHTVNSKGDLFYIDRNFDINKLSNDLETTTTFINKSVDSPLQPQCVYCSPSTGDLLVGILNENTDTGLVKRYKNNGEHTQTIPHNNTPPKLYGSPSFVIENNNGDIVVSDAPGPYRGAVVVTDREGRHRFTYKGRPNDLRLEPYGICIDALSHILVCDYVPDTVQMLSKDGVFLSYLLTRGTPGILGTPRGLCYDINTHLLWVVSKRSTVSVYRHVERHLDLAG